MPTFFTDGSTPSNAPVGRVVQCKDDHTQGTFRFISVKPEEPSFLLHRSIITRLTVSHQCNYQFLHTVGNEIYIYVFGDRVGQITLSGLSFTTTGCDGDSEHGFEKMLKWYERYRVAARQDPVEVMIGRTGMKGFVVGLSGDVVEASTRMMQWGLTIMVLPKKGNNNPNLAINLSQGVPGGLA